MRYHSCIRVPFVVGRQSKIGRAGARRSQQHCRHSQSAVEAGKMPAGPVSETLRLPPLRLGQAAQGDATAEKQFRCNRPAPFPLRNEDL
jgi:hypothetical protein